MYPLQRTDQTPIRNYRQPMNTQLYNTVMSELAQKRENDFKEEITEKFTIKERLVMAYEPVLLDLIGKAYLEVAADTAAEQMLPLKREARAFRKIAIDIENTVFAKLEKPLQKRLNQTTVNAIHTLRLETNLMIDLYNKLKKLTDKYADVLAYTYSAIFFLQMAERCEWRWGKEYVKRCRNKSMLTFNGDRPDIIKSLMSFNKRFVKNEISLTMSENVIQNIIDKFCAELSSEQ